MNLRRDILEILTVERRVTQQVDELEKFVHDYVSEDKKETIMDEARENCKKAVRADVYRAIDGERTYQSKWEDADSKGKHETGAFIVFMEYYLQEARRLESTLENGGNYLQKVHGAEGSLDFVRKVTALGVACMEQNGAPEREG